MVLRLADARSSATLAYDDVMRWPEEERRALLNAGWLRDAGIRRRYTCTDCEEECTEDVHFTQEGEGLPARAFIPCSGGHGRIYLRPESLRHWAVDVHAIAASVAQLAGATGEPQEPIRQRLWWLGRCQVRGQHVTIFFARGAGWRDASTVFGDVAELRTGALQVVLVPARMPTVSAFGPHTEVLSISQMIEVGPSGLHFDRAALEQAIPKSRARVLPQLIPIRTEPGTTWKQVLVEFLDQERVRVSVPGHVEKRSFVEMGFRDRRKLGEQADVLWELLRLLAREEGQLGSADSKRLIPAASFGKVKRWVSDIRSRLRALFPDIGGDPFKPYRTAKAYETEFVLKWVGDE